MFQHSGRFKLFVDCYLNSVPAYSCSLVSLNDYNHHGAYSCSLVSLNDYNHHGVLSGVFSGTGQRGQAVLSEGL